MPKNIRQRPAPKRLDSSDNNNKDVISVFAKGLSKNVLVLLLVFVTTAETYRSFFLVDTSVGATEARDLAVEGPSNVTVPIFRGVAKAMTPSSALREKAASHFATKSPKPAKSTGTTTTATMSEEIPQVKIPPKLQEAMDNNNSNRNIMFVHVGKAGGVAVRQNVAANCWGRFVNQDSQLHTKEENHVLREECFEKTPKEEKLASQTRNVFHMWDLNTTLMEQATTFLVSLRNPVDRVISSYRYTHPGNCRRGETYLNNKGKPKPIPKNYGCELIDRGRMKEGSFGEKIFTKCFPDPAMEDFAQAAMAPLKFNTHFVKTKMTELKKQECRDLAQSLIVGDHHARLVPHFEYNYKYYTLESVDKYPDKEVFALRTEHEFEDMVQLDVAMGGTGKFRNPDNHYSHGSEHYRPSPLSKEAYHKLCCVLHEEIDVYLGLFDKALNLDDNDKKEAEDTLRGKCGLQQQTWTGWRNDCLQRLQIPMKK